MFNEYKYNIRFILKVCHNIVSAVADTARK